MRSVGRYVSQWPIDEDQVLLTGMSDGGTFTHLAGLQDDAPFTHLAPWTGCSRPRWRGPRTRP